MARKRRARYGVIKDRGMSVARLVYNHQYEEGQRIIYQADIGGAVYSFKAEDLEVLAAFVEVALQDREKLEAEGKWQAPKETNGGEVERKMV